jgi:hypothetical protein
MLRGGSRARVGWRLGGSLRGGFFSSLWRGF